MVKKRRYEQNFPVQQQNVLLTIHELAVFGLRLIAIQQVHTTIINQRTKRRFSIQPNAILCRYFVLFFHNATYAAKYSFSKYIQFQCFQFLVSFLGRTKRKTRCCNKPIGRRRIRIFIKRTIKEQRKLLDLEMDYLRRSTGVSRLQKIPNTTIRSKMQAEQSILARIQRRQLDGMEDSRWPKKIYQWTHVSCNIFFLQIYLIRMSSGF